MPRLDGSYEGGAAAGRFASRSTSSSEAQGFREAGAATVDGAMEQRPNREQGIGDALRRNRQGLSSMLNQRKEPESQGQDKGEGQEQKKSTASSSEGDLLNDMIARLSR